MKATSGLISLLVATGATPTAAASLARQVPAAAPPDAKNSTCPQLHVFAARETTAPPGFGSSQTLVDLIINAFPGTTAEAIDYPAAGDANYSMSVTTGVLALLAQVSQFAMQCPDTALIMHGYSQGAQLMDNVFCGGPDGQSLQASPPLVQAAIGNNVAAIVLMGNPRHVHGLPYNIGNATAPGFAARPAGFECPLYQNRIQSYCDSPDPFCANGTDAAFHQGYGKRNGIQALQFVVGKFML